MCSPYRKCYVCDKQICGLNEERAEGGATEEMRGDYVSIE